MPDQNIILPVNGYELGRLEPRLDWLGSNTIKERKKEKKNLKDTQAYTTEKVWEKVIKKWTWKVQIIWSKIWCR